MQKFVYYWCSREWHIVAGKNGGDNNPAVSLCGKDVSNRPSLPGIANEAILCVDCELSKYTLDKEQESEVVFSE